MVYLLKRIVAHCYLYGIAAVVLAGLTALPIYVNQWDQKQNLLVDEFSDEKDLLLELAQEPEFEKRAYLDLADLCEKYGHEKYRQHVLARQFADDPYEAQKADKLIATWDKDIIEADCWRHERRIGVVFSSMFAFFGWAILCIFIGGYAVEVLSKKR